MGRRASTSASRPSKQARFIAIEKRITTWHREAPVLTMPVTCHHRFELCRRALSSKLADSIPPPLLTYVLPPALACGPAGSQWTPHSMLHFESNRLYLQRARFSLKNAPLDAYMQTICPAIMRVFARFVWWSITRWSIIQNVSLHGRIIPECGKREDFAPMCELSSKFLAPYPINPPFAKCNSVFYIKEKTNNNNNNLENRRREPWENLGENISWTRRWFFWSLCHGWSESFGTPAVHDARIAAS